MKRLVAVLLILSFPCRAEGLKYLPKWKMVGDKACYEFEDAKKLVEADLRMDLLFAEEQAFTRAIDDYKKTSLLFQDALELERSSVKLLEKNNDELGKRLLLETERANKAESKQMPLLTTVLGGAGLLLVGLVGGVLLGVYVAK